MAGEALPDPPFFVGERFEKSLRLSAGDIRAFAAAVGDFNPLHHDEALAVRSRYGGLIASGTHSSALMAAFTASFTTERAPGVGLELAFRFHKAVRADDPLTMAWTVTAIEPKPRLGGHVVAFAGEMRDAAGELVVSGTMKTLTFPAEG